MEAIFGKERPSKSANTKGIENEAITQKNHNITLSAMFLYASGPNGRNFTIPCTH